MVIAIVNIISNDDIQPSAIDTCNFLLSLEEIIRTKFLPNLTGQSSFSDAEWDLITLPPTRGGLGIIDPARYLFLIQFSSSVSITAPLVELILQQSHLYTNEVFKFDIPVCC